MIIKRHVKTKPHIKQYDGPATMEIKIQHEDGMITTAIFLLPDNLLAESVFDATCEVARKLSDATEIIAKTHAYETLRPYSFPKRNNL